MKREIADKFNSSRRAKEISKLERIRTETLQERRGVTKTIVDCLRGKTEEKQLI